MKKYVICTLVCFVCFACKKKEVKPAEQEPVSENKPTQTVGGDKTVLQSMTWKWKDYLLNGQDAFKFFEIENKDQFTYEFRVNDSLYRPDEDVVAYSYTKDSLTMGDESYAVKTFTSTQLVLVDSVPLTIESFSEDEGTVLDMMYVELVFVPND